MADYFRALEHELDAYAATSGRTFTSLYIGGGTPTLCLEELERLLPRLSIRGERAMEVLPSHAKRENLARLRQMGINYLSLGLQSFVPSVLHHLGRPHSAEDNHQALCSTAGQFACVDVDLIFDVAFGELSLFLRDLEICFQAEVEQVSTYPLMRFGYTPFGKSSHEPEKEHQVLAQATELAQRYGYERRSVWTFNRRDAPDYSSITREFYLGCGAGAATYTGRQLLINHFSLSAYIDGVESGALPIARKSELSALKSAAYYLFWRAYRGGVDLQRFNTLFPGQRLLNRLVGLLVILGYAERRDEELRLTRRGYDRYHDLERWVTYHFIEPLWAEMMREHPDRQGSPAPLSLSQRFWSHLAGIDKRR